MKRVVKLSDDALLTTGSEKHRTDVEGLRAVAVGLVVLFHANVPFMAGGYVGVDVFFVLSGFLITGVLVREMERDGKVDIARFYARRIRRLLPASALTLIGVALLTFLALPQTRWADTAGDIRWSSLYAVNWRFANRAVDYLAADVAPSPVQHFWSLAVEEQFYLLWPFLLLVFTFAARRRGGRIRRPLTLGLLVVALPSLVWSVYLTQTSPGSAYFVTTTRMWELAIGGGVAISAPLLARMSQRIANPLALFGVVGIVASAVLYGPTTAFPGYTAALPVASTAAVVAAGTAHGSTITGRVLSWKPLVVIGGFSYAIYLWHWPALVAADALYGPLTAVSTTVTVGVAFAIAWVSYRRVEQPIRKSAAVVTPPSRGLVFGLVLTVVGVAAAAWLSNGIPEIEPAPTAGVEPTPATTAAGTDIEGAAGDAVQDAGTTGTPGLSEAQSTTLAPILVQEASTAITPDPLVARDDIPVVYGEGCHQNQEDAEPIFCEFGDVEVPVVALVGDSHAAMWVPTLRILADQYGFRLRSYTKSACAFAAVDTTIGEQNNLYESCSEWNTRVLQELTGSSGPDLVITSISHKWKGLSDSGDPVSGDLAQPILAEGLVTTWTQITQAEVPLVVINDTPRPGFDVPECVVASRDRLSECAFDRAAALKSNTAIADASERTQSVLIDVADRICTPAVCPAVIDDLLVWRDSHHLTATYARRLAAVVGPELEPYLPVSHLSADASVQD